jgi:hypothetical protein
MVKIRIFLLALLFVLGISHAAAKSLHTCCAGGDCAITQCVDMGCAPAVAAIAAGAMHSITPVPVRVPFPVLDTPAPPELPDEIWTPPD